MSYAICEHCRDEVYIEVDDIPESVICYKCYSKQLEEKLKAQQEQINEANEHVAFICRKLDEAYEEGLQYFPIITRGVLHKELSDYVNKHKIKEELAKMEAR